MLKLFRTRHIAARALLLFLGALFVLGGMFLVSIAVTPTPDLGSFSDRKEVLSTKIYDRTGKVLLYDLNPDTTRENIPLSAMSSKLVEATLAIEDSGFYQHGAISLPSFIRAVFANIVSGSYSQGGSTITQQVVKNTILTDQKSIARKIWEWVLAIKLEQTYSKDKILEVYLNAIPYGGTVYGIQAASQEFFGVDAKDLTVAESAYLAALPQAPTHYSPYGNNRDDLEARKNLVLSRMKELGFLSSAEYDAAMAEKVTFLDKQTSSIAAPHFVFYVQQYLEDKYGPDVGMKGYKVITSLDANLQVIAETTVKKYALSNEKNFKANNAALVAIDPKTGEILSMVGSRNYFDPAIDGQYNVALAHRQSGSAIKPFVYAAALAKGYTRNTVVFDLPTQFSTACRPNETLNDTPPCYAPSNFDGEFRGPVNFTTAIAQSINIPAIKALYLAGIPNVVSLTNAVQLNIADPEQYGLSLALGAGAVRLLDLTNAYSIFPDEGMYHDPTAVLSVQDSTGSMLEQFSAPDDRQVIDSGVARDISAMLSDNQARQPEYPPVNPFYFPGYDVAAKTGTTNDSKDFWTIGYTPNIVIGTWAGNNDNSATVKNIAGLVVAPMWNEVMKQVIAIRPKEYFGEPRPIPSTAPAALQGIAPVRGGDPSSVHEILNWLDKNNPQSGFGNSTDDPQYPYWEYSVRLWAQGLPTY